jgi:hypothetical protein
MSESLNQEIATVQTMDIPDAEDIKVTGGKQWRFSRGKIVQGEEKPAGSGNFERETKRLIGRLERVGIYEGIGKSDNQPYSQVECDLMTKEGLQHVKGGLNDPDFAELVLKPSVSTVKFAWALTQYKKGDIVMLEATQSKDPATYVVNGVKKKGSHVTYVNCFRVEGNSATPIYSPKRNEHEAPKSLVDQWLELKPQIEAHDAYAPRPRRDDDDGGAVEASHYSHLCNLCRERKWASPEQATADWLELMRKAFQEEKPRARLNDWDDDSWGQALQTVGNMETVPKTILEATERLYAKQTSIEL